MQVNLVNGRVLHISIARNFSFEEQLSARWVVVVVGIFSWNSLCAIGMMSAQPAANAISVRSRRWRCMDGLGHIHALRMENSAGGAISYLPARPFVFIVSG